MTKAMVLLLVVFADRVKEDAEVLHIISARKAERYEEKIYAAHVQNRNN